jgi:cytochrome c oxidase cbb3-type subunit 2
MNVRIVALFAGVFFIVLATFIQGFLPAMVPESLQTRVSKVVRTDLGELKWMIADATDYTPQQARGRAVYIREGCAYCHSQFVRPVTG